MILELMIINNIGIALYYYNFYTKIKKDTEDHQLIASFLDQIDRITQMELKESLHKIEYGDLIFFFFGHPNSDLRIIFKCDNTKIYSTQLMERSLSLIAKNLLGKFIQRYKNELDNFKGEISLFKSFIENIDEIFKKRVI
jgi:hypothetical protein